MRKPTAKGSFDKDTRIYVKKALGLQIGGA